MGAWGAAVFDNDAAADWIGELLEQGRHQCIGLALAAVTDGSTDADDCSAALAAAEVVAAGQGWPVRGFPKELREWMDAFQYQPTPGEKSLAMEAVRKVANGSELAELWAENAREEKTWRSGLDDLLERLKKTAVPRVLKPQPRKLAPSDAKDAINRLKKRGAHIQTTPAGHAKYVHVTKELGDDTLAESLPFLSKTKVLKIGWGRQSSPPVHMPVSDVAFAALTQFTALQELRLGCTRITDATLARLTGLKKLLELDLDCTSITDRGLAHLAGLTSLESLSLFGTAITDTGLAQLAGLTNLKKLNLCETAVTDAGIAILAGFTGLTELDLRKTKITGAGLQHLAGLTELWLLELDHTAIDDAGIAHLANLSKLARLTVRGKGITDASMETIGRLTGLRGLVMEKTQITDAALPILAELPALEIVHLAGTPITTEGARWLRQARPKLTVQGKDK